MVRPRKIQESSESPTPKRRTSTRRAVPSTPYCLPSSDSSDDEAPPPKRKKDLETSQSSRRIAAKATNPEFTEEKLRNILRKFAPPSFPPSESKEEPTSKVEKAVKKKATKKKRKSGKPEPPQENSSPLTENIEKWDERTTLMDIYKQEPNPSRQMIKEIAKVLKKKQRRVSWFFRYQRNKEKNSGKYSHVTPDIRLKLEEEFNANQNPSTERKREVAAANNLILKTVTNWFVIRRMKEKDPEKWKEMKEKNKAWERDRKRRLRLESNKPPPFKFSEEQRNFMVGKLNEGHEITMKQSKEWAKEINLNGYQVYTFIRRFKLKQIDPEYAKRMRKQHRENSRKRRKESKEEKDERRPAGTPLTEEEAIPIIEKVLKENPYYRECGNGVLINTLFWSKSKINHYICQNPLTEGKTLNDLKMVLTQPIMKTIEPAFERNPFVTASQARAWGKQFKVKPQTFHTFAFNSRTRILKKYLSDGQQIDTLPTTMRLLETEYFKRTFVESVTEAAEIIERTKVEFRHALGYFSMRRRLDRERGVDVIKEEDIPKIYYKDFKNNQKVSSKTPESEERVKLEEPDYESSIEAENYDDLGDELEKEDQPPAIKEEEDSDDELEQKYQPPVNVIKQEDFDVVSAFNRQAGVESTDDESDDDSDDDTDSENFDSEWSSEDLLSGDDEDNEDGGANMLREPKEEKM
ncbi:hypothetical protein GCK72_008624 [Caenorhabditis remanei]|uniref:Homeobox domain-containing protein n=1 Tax=Caenorhabditis remanei TaxID=31234 RepID=A0A6A5H0I1_CAERE|nr:hypothetical protein GCK72_008624 [Caenorhabditis remanei]KAF1760375.1 hypothetical protein GCK72_008624 [Caenorhabditis remanei]